MKAIVAYKYGSPDQLQLHDIEKPVPGENEVLVKIRASTVNDFDWSLVRGKPFVYRLLFGLLKPKSPIPGIELAGTVEATGKNVTAFREGDRVYGDISERGWGCWAEYICVNEDAVVSMPEKMTFEEAASIPHASMLAYQGLVETGQIKQGQQLLINGAGGGVGMFGLQIAKLYGAEVTGVDSGEKLNKMRSMGFDHIIDYKKEDFTKNGRTYDLILDAKTTRSPSAYQRALKSGGTYVTVGGHLNRLIQLVMANKTGKKNMQLVSLKANRQLAYIGELFEAGRIKAVIDGPYPLSEVPRMLQYFGEGKHYGKVVISVPDQKL